MKKKKTLKIEIKNMEVLLCAKVEGSDKPPFALRLVSRSASRGEPVKFGEDTTYQLSEPRYYFSENLDEALSQAETLVTLLQEAKKLK